MPDAKFRVAAEGAGFIFVGTVEREGASMVASAPADEQTAIVRVERVMRAPASVGLVEGSMVTLRTEGEPLKRGERSLYLADPWLYAENIALVERGRLVLDADAPEARMTEDELTALEHGPLRARVRKADVIVRGRVAKLGSKATRATTRPPEPRSEHDPLWWEAEIVVDDVLKGRPGKKVRIAFPTSDDVAWHGWPRPLAGQEAVFLLHRAEPKELKGAYIVPHEHDVQPRVSDDRVRALVREQRG
jgi:hypothetical protein